MAVRRRGLLAALVAAFLLLGAAPATAAPPGRRVSGTYRLLAKDVVEGGGLRHVYEDVLDTGTRMHRLHLPRGHGLRPGDRVLVSADTAGDGSTLNVTSFAPLGTTAATATTGTTDVLVVLAYWTAPDSVTPQRASDQILGDDDRWFREVSYGAVGLTGAVTPWLRIPAPANGQCYAGADTIMTGAIDAAGRAGYAAIGYDRVVVYFPRCTGSDTSNVAGWAYEPGARVWLNGYMDRRTSVHEQGHNYGMGHARAYACTNNGVRVTLGGTCARSEYGDPYDAMGQSSYAAHFDGYNKYVAGWLGTRRRILTTSSSSFTLPPYESASATAPQVVVANSPTRGSYWLEYRRPVGYDAALPAGATGGVLVHLRDTVVGVGNYLLDGTPGDATFATAVLRAGTTWTAPDGVRIAVGSATSTGIAVSITGARPEPQVATAPRSFAASARDMAVRLTWTAPSSDGGAAISGYRVTVDPPPPGGGTGVLAASPNATSLLVSGLGNGTTYTFEIRALNSVGPGAPATAQAVPVVLPPVVSITSPADGAALTGRVTVVASASPNPLSGSAISQTRLVVDDRTVVYGYGAQTSFEWNTGTVANGRHHVEVVVTDANYRTAVAAVDVTTSNPFPVVAVTAPAEGTTFDAPQVVLEAAASVPEGSTAAIQSVAFEVDGYLRATVYSAPYRMTFPTIDNGWHSVVAVATDTNGLTARSRPVSFVVSHPPPTVKITSPANDAVVRGTSLTITADASVTANGSALAEVRFWAGYQPIGTDTTAPFTATWDISGLSGSGRVQAEVVETSGRRATTYLSVRIDNALPTATLNLTYNQPFDAKPMTLTGTATARTAGASVARVDLMVDNVAVPAEVAADGTWSAPWDATGRYGIHRVTVVAYDSAGLHSPTPVSQSFQVVRQPPAVVWTAPEAGSLVPAGTVDVVASATPGTYDTSTVTRICFRKTMPWWQYAPELGCGTLGDDGRYHLAWNTTAVPDGAFALTAVVWMSDGATFAVPGPTVTVARPPLAPEVYSDDGFDGDADLWWSTAPSAAPVTSWVVAVPGRAPVTVTEPRAYLTGLANWHTYDVAVSAVNAMGTGPATHVSVTPGLRTRIELTSQPARTVVYGSRVTFGAVVSRQKDDQPVAGRTVELVGCPVAGPPCPVVARATTSATGMVTLSAVPRTGTDYYLHVPVQVAIGQSYVFPPPVSVSTKVTGTFSAGRVPLGATSYLRGYVTPARTGGFVYLQRYYSGTWHNVTYRTMSATGYVSVPVKVARGTYTYRLRYGGDGGRLPGASPARTLVVY
ncbi:MAG TPA: Ig-like domain-containing protein [Mycobacteriales bacterium]|jgi:hypothetical protein|nr:Ig-like domain-containing protein [Mycobacteriales bacterium]